MGHPLPASQADLQGVFREQLVMLLEPVPALFQLRNLGELTTSDCLDSEDVFIRFVSNAHRNGEVIRNQTLEMGLVRLLEIKTQRNPTRDLKEFSRLTHGSAATN